MMLLRYSCFFFFFNDTATTEIYTLSLHDALPILVGMSGGVDSAVAAAILVEQGYQVQGVTLQTWEPEDDAATSKRSEEHTSELQSLAYLVCRLLLEKKKKKTLK